MIQRRQAILVGLDNLGFCIFEELRSAQIDVTVINREATEFDKDVQRRGGKLIVGNLRDKQLLVDAGLGRAQTLIVVTPDDTTNLILALNALELNPQIRIVLRHFNLSLARQIEANIPNSKVLSPDAIGASAFAIAAHNANTVLSFSFQGQVMTFFRVDTADYRELEGKTVGDIEASRGIKIVSLDSPDARVRFPALDQAIPEGGTLIAFGPLAKAQEFAPREDGPGPAAAALQLDWRRPGLVRGWLNNLDPILGYTIALALVVIVGATFYFSVAEHYTEADALNFVLSTATTPSFSEFNKTHAPWYSKLVVNLVWVAGIILSVIIFALVTNGIMAKRMDFLLGRSRVRKRGHIVVCGLGATGFRVVEELAQLGEQVVVIEKDAENEFIEQARSLDVHVIIAGALSQETLRLANMRYARCLISTIENDMLNLEIALSARDLNAGLRIILRTYQPELTRHLTRRFHVDLTYNTAELAAPAFVSPALHEAENQLTTLEVDEKPHAVIEKAAPEFLEIAGEARQMRLQDVFGAKDMYVLALGAADGRVTVAPAPDAEVGAGDKALYIKRTSQRTWSLIGKAGQQAR